MAMIKVDKQTMQIVGKLHVMIGCQLEAEDMKDANYTTRRIHGIPFASMVGANYDHKAVAQSMLTFIGTFVQAFDSFSLQVSSRWNSGTRVWSWQRILPWKTNV